MKRNHMRAWLVVSWLLVGCVGRGPVTTVAPSQTPTLIADRPTSTPVPPATASATATDSIPTPTTTPPATAAPAISPMAIGTFTPESPLAAVEIETSNYSFNDDPELSRRVRWAVWSDDGSAVYYAFAPATGAKPLQWARYDIAARTTATVPSPLKFDSAIWQRLGVADPTAQIGLYPELRGYMSPSGQKVIFTVAADEDLPTAEVCERVEVWISDSAGQQRAKILGPRCGVISQAAWFDNEAQVLFSFGYEGPAELLLVDIPAATVAPLRDFADIDGTTEYEWALSPDGTTLALINNGLRLLDRETGKSQMLEENAGWPVWSSDGLRLYYWWGPTFVSIGAEMRVYDVNSGAASTVLDTNNTFWGDGQFSVSPRGDCAAIWGGWLWLVTLR